MNNVIAIPHLGASTEEAEDNCAIMAVRQLMKYNENGSIINSVNYPNIKLEDKSAKHRVLILHDASIDIVKSLDLHGATLIEKATNQKFGVFVYDTNQPIHPSMISRIEGVLRVQMHSKIRHDFMFVKSWFFDAFKRQSCIMKSKK
jgi:D-3-phosphoglycerate dehydrogenase / 2-oxoglutarate reductase